MKHRDASVHLIWLTILFNLKSAAHAALSTSSLASNDVNLSIAVILPKLSADGGCTHRAIQMAFDDVNSKDRFIFHRSPQNPNISDSFKLQPKYSFTSRSVGDAIEAMHSSFQQNDIFATIGPPYNEQVEYCTEYTTANANIQISYSEANEPYERYFVMYHQTPPSIFSGFDTTAQLLKRFNWTRVGLIYDYSDKRYRKNADKIRNILSNTKAGDTNIEVLADQGIWSIPADYSVTKELGDLQDKGIRIIVALVSTKGARKVFCEAYQRKMYRPKVIWIILETLPEDWASDTYNSYATSEGFVREVSCTEEELLFAADGYISIAKIGMREDNKKTISSMTAKDFTQRLHEGLQPGVQCNSKAAYAYDAVWVLALGSRQMALGQNLSLYHHENYVFSMSMSHMIKLVDFEGITGRFKYDLFSANRLRIGLQSVMVNHKGQKPTLFAVYSAFTATLDMIPGTNKLVFGNEIPKDRAVYNISFEVFDHEVLIIMWMFAIIGIVLALTFALALIYLLIVRSKTLDTPIIDFLIIFGLILCYSAVIVYGVDTRFTNSIRNVCTSFLWIFSLGFTLSYGGLFTKTWRIYKQYMTLDVKIIDSTNRNKSKHVPEWILLMVIGIFVTGDIVILSVWTKTSPFTETISNVTTELTHFADVIDIKQVIECTCDKQTHFTIGIYCYKGLLLIFGIFLAWQTRHAKIKFKNDSKEIAMAIYNIVAVSVIGTICVTVLSSTSKNQALFSIIAVCIIISTTTTLMLVFLKKIRKMFLSEERNISTGTINNGNEASTGKYTLEYMRKPVVFTPEKYSRQMSDMTLTTQVSLSESPPSLHMTTLKGDGNLISVVNQNVSSLSSTSPLSIDIQKESLRKLDSGIYIGAASSDEDEKSPTETLAPSSPQPQVENPDCGEMVETIIEFDQAPEQ